MKLSEEQELAIQEVMATSKPILITGSAGTGKSVVLRELVTRLSLSSKVAVAAPTGIAALNVQGITLHSLFGFKVGTILHADWHFRKTGSEFFKDLDVLVIDEISMVRVDMMDMIDTALRFHRDHTQPFGGLKLVMFGDPFQLPPVVTEEDIRASGSTWFVWNNHYRGRKYFFASDALRHTGVRVLELTEIHRQGEDKEFAEILNRVRIGRSDANDLKIISSKSKQELPDHEALRIFGLNKVVDAHNRGMLKLLPPDAPFTSIASWVANPESLGTPLADQIRGRSFAGVEKLELKLNARVIFIRNDDGNGNPELKRWVNGTMGTVVGISNSLITVRTDSGRSVNVRRVNFEVRELVRIKDSLTGVTRIRTQVTGWMSQFPLRLGWAITVHKSQGQTLDEAVLDFDDQYFEAGQAYVALSRVKSLDTLFFLSDPTGKDVIDVDYDVNVFMNTAEKYPFDRDRKKLEQLEDASRILHQTVESEGYSVDKLDSAIATVVGVGKPIQNKEVFIAQAIEMINKGDVEKLKTRLRLIYGNLED